VETFKRLSTEGHNLEESRQAVDRTRKDVGKCKAVRDSLFTFLEHPDAPPDNNGSERDLRPMVVHRKVTGGFRSAWGPDLCAAVTSVVGTAARRGIDAYHAIHAVLSGRTVLAPS
jgi:transposase